MFISELSFFYRWKHLKSYRRCLVSINFWGSAFNSLTLFLSMQFFVNMSFFWSTVYPSNTERKIVQKLIFLLWYNGIAFWNSRFKIRIGKTATRVSRIFGEQLEGLVNPWDVLLSGLSPKTRSHTGQLSSDQHWNLDNVHTFWISYSGFC